MRLSTVRKNVVFVIPTQLSALTSSSIADVKGLWMISFFVEST